MWSQLERNRRTASSLTGGWLILLLASGPPVCAQPGSTSGARATSRPLHERELVIRERLQRLENRMLQLAHLLAENEPERAERLRDALDRAGERGIKRRTERLVELLRSERFSDAEAEQEAVLADLQSVLDLLTGSFNEMERRRAERRKLEQFKRRVRALMDVQVEIVQRTRQVAESAADELRRVERLQRDAQEQAAALQREMDTKSERDQATPGARQLGQARERMQAAADRLGERRPTEAETQQQAALERLQQALNELDDALRQVRREELEQTLTALEVRFRSMLERERQVRAAAGALHEKGPDDWARSDQLELAETAQTQQQVAQDCEATLGILVDEGSTVIVPEIVRQLHADMRDAAVRLNDADVSPATQRLLDDVIQLLEQIVAAIETKRERVSRMGEPGGGAATDQSAPLLPRSAELKLLRSVQVRINGRTSGLLQGDDAGKPPARERRLRRLSERQRLLAKAARRMNERRQ